MKIDNDKIRYLMDNAPAAATLLKSSLQSFIAVFHWYRHSENFTFRPFHLEIIKALESRVFRANATRGANAAPLAPPAKNGVAPASPGSEICETPEKELHIADTPFFTPSVSSASAVGVGVSSASEKGTPAPLGANILDSKHLYIGMPPRFGKTQIVKYFVAWSYAINPACNYILTSYGAELVADTSKYIRELIGSELYRKLFPGVMVDSASSASDLWKIKGGGGFRAATLEGVVTGFGAGTAGEGYGGALIIDDFLKATDARSAAAKAGVIAAYTGSLKSRRNSPQTPIVVIAQRLAIDDLIGYIEENEREQWDFLLLKGYDEEKGKSAWEERITTAELERLRAQAPGVFAAQYQQTPIVAGGDVFKTEWWGFYDPGDAGYIYKRVYICADTAMKTGQQNDFTVLGCFGIMRSGEIHLLDMVRGKFEAPELEKVFTDFYEKWRRMSRPGLPKVSAVYIEDKASGTGLIQSVRRKGIPVIPMKPTRDKYTRALEAVPTIAAGLFKLPKNASDRISAAVIAECEAFRSDMSHVHDDIVDVICYGVEKSVRGGGFI